MSELKKSTGQTQQKDDFSKPSRLYFRGFEFFVTKQRAPLTFICSPERSGTHFLINALKKNIGYASKQFLNVDPNDLWWNKMSLNFNSVDELCQFFSQLENLRDEGERRYLAGFFKSHFYAQFLENFLTQDRKFIYIVRNPVDTLISFWKFLHQYAGEKGAAEKLYGRSICEFLELSPTESCFRYQNKHVNDYFSRWADNVEGWLEMKDKHANIIFVKYENLKNHYTPTMNVILKAFGYEEQKFCKNLLEMNIFVVRIL